MAEIVAFPQSAGTDRSTILVVDDEPAIRGFLVDYLQESGFQAVAVASGDDAAALIDRGAPHIDLVFSDVRMPGTLDGFGLARWVMAHHPGLPVLLVSGDLGKLNAASEIGGFEIMPKPYDFTVAVKKIRAAIEARRTGQAGERCGEIRRFPIR